MAAFNKFNQWPQDLATAVHNLNTAALMVMLTNTAPAATNAVKADKTSNSFILRRQPSMCRRRAEASRRKHNREAPAADRLIP